MDHHHWRHWELGICRHHGRRLTLRRLEVSPRHVKSVKACGRWIEASGRAGINRREVIGHSTHSQSYLQRQWLCRQNIIPSDDTGENGYLGLRMDDREIEGIDDAR